MKNKMLSRETLLCDDIRCQKRTLPTHYCRMQARQNRQIGSKQNATKEMLPTNYVCRNNASQNCVAESPTSPIPVGRPSSVLSSQYFPGMHFSRQNQLSLFLLFTSPKYLAQHFIVFCSWTAQLSTDVFLRS